MPLAAFWGRTPNELEEDGAIQLTAEHVLGEAIHRRAIKFSESALSGRKPRDSFNANFSCDCSCLIIKYDTRASSRAAWAAD